MTDHFLTNVIPSTPSWRSQKRAVGSSSSVSSGYTVVEADPCEPHERCVLCSLTAHTNCWHSALREEKRDEDLVGEQRRVEGWVLTTHMKVTVGIR